MAIDGETVDAYREMISDYRNVRLISPQSYPALSEISPFYFPSLPLDHAWRLAGDVIHHTTDVLDLVDDAGRPIATRVVSPQ